MNETSKTRPARVASWLLFAAVASAPLPFGSSQLVTVAFWCVVLGGCLIFAPVRFFAGGQLALAAVAGVIVAAYGLVLHEQLAVAIEDQQLSRTAVRIRYRLRALFIRKA